jgi:Putative Ig domain
MAAPSKRQAGGEEYASGTEHSVPKPSEVVNGDWIEFTFYVEGTGLTIALSNGGSGTWEKRHESVLTGEGTPYTHVTFVKKYEGEAGPYKLTWGGTSRGVVTRFYVVKNTNGPNVSSAEFNTTKSTKFKNKAYTTTVAETLEIWAACQEGAYAVTSVPTGFSAAVTTDNGFYIGEKTLASAGEQVQVEGTTGTATKNSSHLIAWAPVGEAPVVTKPSTQENSKGFAVTPLKPSATNSPTGWEQTGLPTGLSINASTGEITGTPTAAVGNYTVGLKAKNGFGTSAEVTFKWKITATPVITKPANQVSTVGVAGSLSPSSEGASLTWSAEHLPAGLLISSSTGEITGTPTTAEAKHTVTLKITSAVGGSAETTFEWTVGEVPVITKPGKQENSKGSTITPLKPFATNTPTSWTQAGLPTGLSFNTGTGEITGTPSAAIGEYTVELQAANTFGSSLVVSFIWKITATPSITKPSEQTSHVSNSITPLKPSSEGSGLTWSAEHLPGGLSINAGTGEVTGTPTGIEAKHSVTLKITSSLGGNAETTFNWTVEPEEKVELPPFSGLQISSPQIIIPYMKPAVTWDWYLGRPIFNGTTGAFESYERIGLLSTAHERSLSLSLNGVESAKFSVNTLDPLAKSINSISTCIICYRNGELKWGGPVWTIDETVAEKEQKVNITCVGWFQLLLMRLLKTGPFKFGEESPLKGVGPSATSTATSHTYTGVEPQLILQDLVERANYEYPTGITFGTLESNPAGVKWNTTYQRLQNIGQAIQQLSNTEGGFDFRVDPATLKLNVYYKPVKAGTTVYGRGQDRPTTIFGFKWGAENLSSLQRTIDGSQLVNQMTAVGQYGVQGIYTSLESVKKYGLFEAQQSLSTVVSNLILAAFASVEVIFRENPLPIYTFVPMSVSKSGKSVPQPLVDYDIGDFVYLGAKYGRMNVFEETSSGALKAQPARVFAMNIGIDDNGKETVEEVQTTYQGTGA